MEALGATTVLVSESSASATLPLQLLLFQYLAYYTAIRLGYDPDRPKNLTYYVRIEVSEP